MPNSRNTSILLLLNGHNFSQASATIGAFREQTPGTVPVVAVDTHKTVLIPAYLAEPGTEEAYLHFNGLGISAGERVISARKGDIVALMAVRGDICDMAGMEWEECSFTSPLLEITSGGRREVNIFLTAENAYMAVVDKELKMAEVLPDPSADSLLYYLQVLGRRFRLKKFDINIDGTGADQAVQALSPYFRNVRLKQLCG